MRPKRFGSARLGAPQHRLLVAAVALGACSGGSSLVERMGSIYDRIAGVENEGQLPAEPAASRPAYADADADIAGAEVADGMAAPDDGASEMAGEDAMAPPELLIAEAAAAEAAPAAVPQDAAPAAPGGPEMVVQAEQAPMADPAPDAAPEMPAGPEPVPAVLAAEAGLDHSVIGRMRRLEAGLARLEHQFAELRPSIDLLLAIEVDLDELVDQLFLLADARGVPAPPRAPAPARPPPAAAVAPPLAVDGAPMPLLPGAAPPAAAENGLAAVAPHPVAQPAAPALSSAFALHLASYRRRENAIAGWDELRAMAPEALAGLRAGTARFEKAGEGTFIRLNAGPLASRAESEARCRQVQAAGLYCAVLPYTGTTPM